MDTVKFVRFGLPATLLAMGLALAATPSLSQGAMGPGGAVGAPMAPQPRVAAPPPVVAPPVVPQAPVAPQIPMALPNPSVPSSKPAGEPAKAIIAGAVIAVKGAPKVLSPANGATVGGPDSKTPITFHWTTVDPKPQEPVTYRLRVWQLMQGQNGTQAMATNQPVVTKDVDNLPQMSIASPGCSQNSCSFVWSVQALSRDGKPVGENNGTSDPAGFKTAGAVGATTNPTLPGTSTNNSSSAIFDRWGSSFASSTNFAPLPRARVTSSGGATSAAVSTQTNDKGIFTVGAGQNGQETRSYPITSIIITLPANPDANMKAPPPVLVGLGLSTKPFSIRGNEQQALGGRIEVAHVFPGSVLGKTLNIKVTMPQGSGDATVDWGDGSPATNIHEGKPMAGTVAASDPAIVGVVNLLKAP